MNRLFSKYSHYLESFDELWRIRERFTLGSFHFGQSPVCGLLCATLCNGNLLRKVKRELIFVSLNFWYTKVGQERQQKMLQPNMQLAHIGLVAELEREMKKNRAFSAITYRSINCTQHKIFFTQSSSAASFQGHFLWGIYNHFSEWVHLSDDSTVAILLSFHNKNSNLVLVLVKLLVSSFSKLKVHPLTRAFVSTNGIFKVSRVERQLGKIFPYTKRKAWNVNDGKWEMSLEWVLKFLPSANA